MLLLYRYLISFDSPLKKRKNELESNSPLQGVTMPGCEFGYNDDLVEIERAQRRWRKAREAKDAADEEAMLGGYAQPSDFIVRQNANGDWAALSLGQSYIALTPEDALSGLIGKLGC